MPAHIRRTRPAPSVGLPRVTRTRRAQPAPVKPYYLVDFSLPWGSLFQLYLMASYLYYVLNKSVISNDEYDRVCGILYQGWLRARHPHKHLISRDDLKVVTGYGIRYPLVVQHAAMRLLDNFQER